jgi:hypothetical protein
MMRRTALVLLVLVWPGAAAAQTGVPTSWTLTVFVAGATTAQSTLVVPVTTVACNQAAPAAGTNLNPTRWIWDDPALAGRVCIYGDATRFAALVDGNYEGTASASNADGTSVETTRVPFVRRRPNLPGAPTGLRIIP